VQAIKDLERTRRGRRLAQRLGYAVNGLIYAGLALSAVRLVLGSGGGGNSNPRLTARRFQPQPWLVGTVGAFIIGLLTGSTAIAPNFVKN